MDVATMTVDEARDALSHVRAEVEQLEQTLAALSEEIRRCAHSGVDVPAHIAEQRRLEQAIRDAHRRRDDLQVVIMTAEEAALRDDFAVAHAEFRRLVLSEIQKLSFVAAKEPFDQLRRCQTLGVQHATLARDLGQLHQNVARDTLTPPPPGPPVLSIDQHLSSILDLIGRAALAVSTARLEADRLGVR
jgi:septal ring factor EnvC (AmiA/AmiB activator)